MIIDNIDYFSVDKLEAMIEQRFGQTIKLSEMDDSTLDLFKHSIEQSIASFERSMGFNSNAQNPKYLENKLLQDAIIKEQEMRVKRVQGDKIEIEDPQKPGVTTTIDTKEVDVDTDTAVKWFTLAIVLVFDPLAICMVIGFNVAHVKLYSRQLHLDPNTQSIKEQYTKAREAMKDIVKDEKS